MRRYYALLMIMCCMFPDAVHAQKLAVESMKMAGNDISASQYRCNDMNGQACALVRVQLATPGVSFAGNVIGTPQFKEGEYWVYVTAGTKELEVKHKSFVPCHVTFSDYGILPLQGLTTYVLTLLLPQAGGSVQTQKLTINYSPANAMVLIDSEPHQGNGRIELTLPVGTHNYQVVAMGYETAEGSIKLTNSQPRTITEHLVAKAQQPAVQQAVPPVVQPIVEQTPATPATPAPSQPSTTTVSSSSASAIETITVNGVSFNMVRVDGGTFTMGATKEQKKTFISEKPLHQVTLSSYYIGETEVTQELWQAVMGSNPSYFKGNQRPVEHVSWEDCQEFIRKLNEKTGRQFRLPTEAEWEFAARGGNKSRGYQYSGSNKLKDVAWYYNNNGASTLDVKTKQANELGIYDMSGNIREWCQDWYGIYSNGAETNPTGPASGSGHINRGGCWCDEARYCRSSYRSSDIPTYSDHHLGLRLVL